MSAPQATLDRVEYRYPGAVGPALSDANLTIEQGSFCLLAGPSSGGKSTLLRTFNGLVPQFHGGSLSGQVRVAGLDPSRTPARDMALTAGMVFQEPEAQAITETVEEELAFGLEQRGVPAPEMRIRIERVLEALAIAHLRERKVITLSGGERQRLALASVLVLEPALLLLDEPTSQLDNRGAEDLISLLRARQAAGDLTTLIAEHRLERLLPLVDTVIAVREGKVQALTPREAANELEGAPPVCRLARALGLSPLPLTVEEAAKQLPRGLAARPRPSCAQGAALIEASDVSVAYGAVFALRHVSFTLREGEVVALMGANGSGKTSLFRALVGLSPLASGSVRFAGRPIAGVRVNTAFAGLVPQDPALALYRETVREELAETLSLRGGGKALAQTVEQAAAGWGVAHLLERNPRDLSVGQQQCVALGAMLAHEPKVWLMDEPTRGADGPAKAWLAGILREHAARGGAAIVATHDRESAAHFADRVIELHEGSMVADEPASLAFSASGRQPTQVARLVPGALTFEEVAL
jgi:energy-coupling factor transport system ATP-binding protein